MKIDALKTKSGKVGKWESGTRLALLFLVCSLSHLLTCSLFAAVGGGIYIPGGGGGTLTDGSGLTNLNASNLASGTIPNGRFPATFTNSVYASNVLSGGQLPVGTVGANTGTNGNVLMFDGTSRVWSNAPSLQAIYGTGTVGGSTSNLNVNGTINLTGPFTNSGAAQIGGVNFANVSQNVNMSSGTLTVGSISGTPTITAGAITGTRLTLSAASGPPSLASAGIILFTTGTNTYFVIRGGDGVNHTNKINVTADTYP